MINNNNNNNVVIIILPIMLTLIIIIIIILGRKLQKDSLAICSFVVNATIIDVK